MQSKHRSRNIDVAVCFTTNFIESSARLFVGHLVLPIEFALRVSTVCLRKDCVRVFFAFPIPSVCCAGIILRRKRLRADTAYANDLTKIAIRSIRPPLEIGYEAVLIYAVQNSRLWLDARILFIRQRFIYASAVYRWVVTGTQSINHVRYGSPTDPGVVCSRVFEYAREL